MKVAISLLWFVWFAVMRETFSSSSVSGVFESVTLALPTATDYVRCMRFLLPLMNIDCVW